VGTKQVNLNKNFKYGHDKPHLELTSLLCNKKVFPLMYAHRHTHASEVYMCKNIITNSENMS